MLHTKSQGHRPPGSGEEDFLRVFTIYGRGGHLGHVTKTIWTNFRSPILRSLHMKYEFSWPSSFRGEDVWKCWRTTDGWTTDAGVTGILLAHQWAFGSGELKINYSDCETYILNTFPATHDICRQLSHLLYILCLVSDIANNMYQDQTAPKGAVWSGFILFASMVEVFCRAFECMQQARQHFQDKHIGRIKG